MNKPVRWGIWGAGAIANKVASDFPNANGAVLHAVASRTEDRARRFAAEHHIPHCYTSLQALLADPEIEAVYVGTPNQCHAPDTIACLEAGKAVLCEKPFALNEIQARQVVETARRRGLFCMEAMWTRFLPAVVEAKRLIDSGAIGPVRFLQGNFAFQAPFQKDARLFNLAMGGGALLDIGVYPLSIAHYFLGMPESIRGEAHIGATGVDEQSSYQLTFPGGVMADLWASLHVRGTNEFTVFGELGSLRLCEPFFGAFRLELRSHPRALPAHGPDQSPRRSLLSALHKIPAAKLAYRRLSSLGAMFGGRARVFPFASNGYQFEIAEVSRCVRELVQESSVMPLDSTLDVMRILDTLRSQWGLVYPQEQDSVREHSR